MQEETQFDSTMTAENGDGQDRVAVSEEAVSAPIDEAAVKTDVSDEFATASAASDAETDAETAAAVPYEGDLEPDDVPEPATQQTSSKAAKPSAAFKAALPPLEEVAPDELAQTAAALIARNVRSGELSGYLNALRAGMAGNKRDRAVAALHRLAQTGSDADLNRLRACFPASVQQRVTGESLKRLKQERRAFRNVQEAHARLYMAKKQERFAAENDRWLRAPERRQAVETALALGKTHTDLNALKTLVDGIEKAAVGRYLKKQAARENRLLQEKIGSAGVSSSVGAARPSPWLTRAEFNRLTPQEYDKRYDRIVQQIELEKQGKLPRRLT